MTAGDRHALWPLDGHTLRMQPGAEESRLSFDFVAGQGKGQEQLFRGEQHRSCDPVCCSRWSSSHLHSVISRSNRALLVALQLWAGQ